MKYNVDTAPNVQREEFLDSDAAQAIVADVQAGLPIYFRCNDTLEYNVSADSTAKYDSYFVLLYGVDTAGTKMTVVLCDAPVFFDVRVEPCENPEHYNSELKKTFVDRLIHFTRTEIVKGYRPNEFTIEPDNWIRIYFHNQRHRHTALAFVQKSARPDHDGSTAHYGSREHSLFRMTAADDDGIVTQHTNYYYPKLAREHNFNTTDWNTVSNYTVANAHQRERFHIVTERCLMVNIANYTRAMPSEISRFMWYKRDKSMIMDWDIETYNSVPGIMPSVETDTWCVFMISMNFHWFYTTDTLLKVLLVDVDTAVTQENYMTLSELETKARKTGRSIESLVAAEGRCVTIVCGNEENILRMFIRFLRSMRPDFVTAFNSGSFDWPLMREKMYRFRLLREFRAALSTWAYPEGLLGGDVVATETYIRDRSFTDEQMKINATENMSVVSLDIPGVIDTDMLPIFKQLYPRMEVSKSFSLNFFLKKNKLPGKEDMPYKVMFRIYEDALGIKSGVTFNKLLEQNTGEILERVFGEMPDASPEDILAAAKEKATAATKSTYDAVVRKNLEEMALIAKYCTVDAYRCQQLQTVRTIIQDRRELANDSAVNLFEGIFRANGRKVRQLVGIVSWNSPNHKYPVMFSAKRPENDKIKFIGGYVTSPKRGMNRRRPVVGVDFASLYPNLIITYNFSGEMAIADDPAGRGRKFAEELRAAGYILRDIEFGGVYVCPTKPEKDGKEVISRGWVVRHSNVLKPGDTVNHVIGGVPCARQGQQPLEREIMGIYPLIQSRLFADRRVYKKQYVALKELLEYMSAKSADGPIDWATTLTEEQLKATGLKLSDMLEITRASGNTLEDELVFAMNVVNSKQSAKKVFMNTFYGEQGNYMSSIHNIITAGGITSSGQYNIKLVASMVTAMGYDVQYGDTDSCYTCAPEELFTVVDRAHAANASAIDAMNIEDWGNHRAPEMKPVRDIIDQRLSVAITDYNAVITRVKAEQNNYDARIAAVNAAYTALCDAISGQFDTTDKAELTYLRAINRIEYWKVMVILTRIDATRLVGIIGGKLRDDNGTSFLNMDYEEVIFPCDMTGKKKYFGVAHHATENFYPTPDEIFIRGLDVLKQGQTDLSREIGMEIITRSLDPMCDLSIRTLVEQAISDIYTRPRALSYYALSAKYKAPGQVRRVMPDGKTMMVDKPGNIPVRKFVQRMDSMYTSAMAAGNIDLAALYKPPEIGDPFQYVVVVKPTEYAPRGKRIDLKKGDKMEYVEVFKSMEHTNNPMKIDIKYYIDGALGMQMARFIADSPEFQPSGETDPDKIDELSSEAAKKYILGICDVDGGRTKEMLRATGQKYRTAAKAVVTEANSRLMSRGKIDLASIVNIFDDTPVEDYKAMEKRIAENYESVLDQAQFIMLASQTPGVCTDWKKRTDGGERRSLRGAIDNIVLGSAVGHDIKERIMLINAYARPDAMVGGVFDRKNWTIRHRAALLADIKKLTGIVSGVLCDRYKKIDELIVYVRDGAEAPFDVNDFGANEIHIRALHNKMIELAGLDWMKWRNDQIYIATQKF